MKFHAGYQMYSGHILSENEANILNNVEYIYENNPSEQNADYKHFVFTGIATGEFNP